MYVYYAKCRGGEFDRVYEIDTILGIILISKKAAALTRRLRYPSRPLKKKALIYYVTTYIGTFEEMAFLFILERG